MVIVIDYWSQEFLQIISEHLLLHFECLLVSRVISSNCPPTTSDPGAVAIMLESRDDKWEGSKYKASFDDSSHIVRSLTVKEICVCSLLVSYEGLRRGC